MIPDGAIPATLLIFFAIIGIVATIYVLVKWWSSGVQSLKNFNALITETRDFLKDHRQDLRAAGQLREIFAAAEEQASPKIGPIQADAPSPQPDGHVGMPKPIWEMFTTKPPEPDAPSENVDVSPTEEELSDEDKADQLERMGLGRPDPEFKPKAVEVDSE